MEAGGRQLSLIPAPSGRILSEIKVMLKPLKTLTLNLDDLHNLSVKVVTQSGQMRQVPLSTATVNVDDDGNLCVVLQGFDGGSADFDLATLLSLITAKANGGIKIESIGGKLVLSADTDVVDTSQEENYTSTEIKNMVDSILI
jgi:hypothetical protein